ncbi:VIER F-box protein 2 [Tanacetum coccineum]
MKVEIPGLPTIPSDMKEENNSDDGDLDVYEPRKVDVKFKEGVISKWLVQGYKKQFDEYMEIKKQWVTHGIKADMEYDPSDVEFVEWLASKFYNHMTMDRYTKNALWIYWTRGEDEVELTDEEISDPNDENFIDKDEFAKIFRIKTNIFDFETPISKAFNEFNYLLKIDTDLLTSDITGFKAYDEFKNEWMDEWNKGIPWVLEEPWFENGISIDDIHYICEPIRFKNGKAKLPICNSNDEGFCNGGKLLGMIRVGYMTYF